MVHFLWKLIWRIAHLVRPLLCTLELDGVENVPLSGGCVLASNHRSAVDIIVKGYICPRQIHFMAKIELFQVNPIVANFSRPSAPFP